MAQAKTLYNDYRWAGRAAGGRGRRQGSEGVGWEVFAASAGLCCTAAGAARSEARVCAVRSVIPAQNAETSMPTSERQNLILGLNLLFLLSQNRMAEFHTELVTCRLGRARAALCPPLSSASYLRA